MYVLRLLAALNGDVFTYEASANLDRECAADDKAPGHVH